MFFLVGGLYLRSLAVAMEVMVVMVVMVVGTVMSLKMDWLPLLDDTLFSLRVPMIICRISLLASPRTASRAWMCSSLQGRTDGQTGSGQQDGTTLTWWGRKHFTLVVSSLDSHHELNVFPFL